MSMTVPMGWTCGCGAFVPNGVNHSCGGTFRFQKSPSPIGWTCPACGAGVAPWVREHCAKGAT